MRDPKEDRNGGTEKIDDPGCDAGVSESRTNGAEVKLCPRQSVVALPSSCDLEDHGCQHDRIVITFHFVEITQERFGPL
jgi:hypothetical protein